MNYFIAAILSITFPHPENSFCDCDTESLSLDSVYKFSSLIFVGKVEKTIPTLNIVDERSPSGYSAAEFTIIESIKGSSNSHFQIATDNSNCRVFFNPGNTYLVASQYDSTINKYIVHRCFYICPDINSDLGKKSLQKIKSIASQK